MHRTAFTMKCLDAHYQKSTWMKEVGALHSGGDIDIALEVKYRGITMNEHCVWFDITKLSKEERRYLNRSIKSIGDARFCKYDEETLHICTESIRCVPLEQIKDIPAWSEMRYERIKKWADRETLNTLRNISDRSLNIPYDLPIVGREIEVGATEKKRFGITNGIHRIYRARELDMDCILAKVVECVIIKKKEHTKLKR